MIFSLPKKNPIFDLVLTLILLQSLLVLLQSVAPTCWLLLYQEKKIYVIKIYQFSRPTFCVNALCKTQDDDIECIWVEILLSWQCTIGFSNWIYWSRTGLFTRRNVSISQEKPTIKRKIWALPKEFGWKGHQPGFSDRFATK